MNMSKWDAKEGQKMPKDVHEITFYFGGDVTFHMPKWVSREDIRNWYLEPTGISMGQVEWTLTLEMKDGERHKVSPAEYPCVGTSSIHFYAENGSGVPAKEE